jgi:cryptochrome
VSLYGQLLWREFFYCASVSIPNFGSMEGNPNCRQIDWDTNEEHLRAWELGRTGYPWIDAIMNQLRREGWMHHLARHSVACFLTRGDLYLSWEAGADIFSKYLLDADWAINAGNWQWLSASAFFSQYFRVRAEFLGVAAWVSSAISGLVFVLRTPHRLTHIRAVHPTGVLAHRVWQTV